MGVCDSSKTGLVFWLVNPCIFTVLGSGVVVKFLAMLIMKYSVAAAVRPRRIAVISPSLPLTTVS